MLVYESGIFEGGISGGCLEGDALQKSQTAIARQFPTLVTYDTSKDDENNIGVGLGCNGVIDVLISPMNSEAPTHSQIETLRKCISTRKLHILVTLTGVSVKMDELYLGKTFYYNEENNRLENFPDSKIEAFLLEQIEILKNLGKSKTVEYKQGDQNIRAFIELFPPPIHLAIFGDNYDVYPLIRLAELLGWKISLVANLHKMSKNALSGVDEIYNKADSARPLIDDRTAIILMAHDFKTDCDNLAFYLQSPAKYIGLLGPKKRFLKMENELREKKITLNDKQNIFAPCGLEIGANFPEDIAMSILSEISAVFADKKGAMLKYKETPIHDREE